MKELLFIVRVKVGEGSPAIRVTAEEVCDQIGFLTYTGDETQVTSVPTADNTSVVDVWSTRGFRNA